MIFLYIVLFPLDTQRTLKMLFIGLMSDNVNLLYNDFWSQIQLPPSPPPPTALPVIHPRVVFTRVVVEFIHVTVNRFTISYKLSFNFVPQGIYIYNVSLSNLMLANLANIYHVCIILSLQCLSPL